MLAGCSAAPEDLASELVETPGNSTAPEETSIETAEPLASFELSSLSEDPELCKLVEDSRMRYPGMENPDFYGEAEIRGRYNGNATAFPFAPTVLPVTGELNAVMVMVDWEDLPGDSTEYDFYKFHLDGSYGS